MLSTIKKKTYKKIDILGLFKVKINEKRHKAKEN